MLNLGRVGDFRQRPCPFRGYAHDQDSSTAPDQMHCNLGLEQFAAKQFESFIRNPPHAANQGPNPERHGPQ